MQRTWEIVSTDALSKKKKPASFKGQDCRGAATQAHWNSGDATVKQTLMWRCGVWCLSCWGFLVLPHPIPTRWAWEEVCLVPLCTDCIYICLQFFHRLKVKRDFCCLYLDTFRVDGEFWRCLEAFFVLRWSWACHGQGRNTMEETLWKMFPTGSLIWTLLGRFRDCQKTSHWWFTEARGSTGFETLKESWARRLRGAERNSCCVF